MSAINEKQFEFLDPIDGRQGYTSVGGNRTYSRILDGPFHKIVQALRERIAPGGVITSCDVFKQMGDDYCWGGRSMPKSGFFRTIETSDNPDRTSLNSHQYALEKIGQPLEVLTGKSIKEIQHECATYGIEYFVGRFFNTVEIPQDGDLVVYYDYHRFYEPIHSGIFRIIPSTGHFPHGGTVESKWYRGYRNDNPYVFQHDVFFLPKHCGDVARFYRIKTAIEPKILPKHDSSNGPMSVRHEDGTFWFVEAPANRKIRLTIDQNPHSEWNLLVTTLPQIECLADVPFFGACYGYALAKIFKSGTKSIPSREEELIGTSAKSELIETYFTITSDPEPGDLAVYSDRDGRRQHFGVYIAEDLIESKWGAGKVYRHPPFYVCSDYGNQITYYRLKS